MSDQEHREEVVTQVQSAVAPLATIIQEVKDVLTTHISKEGDRIQSIDDRLDKHLEIYANNGKEAKRVADNLERMIEREKVRDDRAEARDKKVDEMYKQFQDDKIVAEADKKRLQNIILYGGAVGGASVILAFLAKLLR